MSYTCIQGRKIAGKELNGLLELADVVSFEERMRENVANEGSEEEKKSGRGNSRHPCGEK